jgi:membrane protease YdiL (CAAX protease family)
MGGMMVLMVIAAYAVITPVVNSGVVYLGYMFDGQVLSWPQYFEQARTYSIIWGLLGSHLGLGSMILVIWAYFRFIHRRRMEWLWSVSPGVRWRYGILCAGVALVVIGAVCTYHWMTGPGWAPINGWPLYCGMILITVPIQALAEEVMFRGYLMQLFGSIVHNVWFPIVGTALVFALFHGVQNPWLFGSRFVFGVIAGILVWRTGGLEAAVAIHIVNNLLVFALAIVTGTLVEVRTATEAPWTQTVTDTAMFAVCAMACLGLAIKMRVPIVVRKR